MSQAPSQPSADDLQFQSVETPAGGAAPPMCAVCKRPIADSYFAAGPKLVCPNCRGRFAAVSARGSRAGRLFKATLYGILGGVAGAIVWFAVRKISGYELGLIALVVGILVGQGVRIGSGGRGGAGYRLLAVVLTYCAVCSNYVPDVAVMAYHSIQQAAHRSQTTAVGVTTPSHGAAATSSGASVTSTGSPKPAISPTPGLNSGSGPAMTIVKGVAGIFLLFIAVFVIALIAPILAGIHNPIGLLIIGIALWEAWKISALRTVQFTGPFSLRNPGQARPLPPVAAGIAR